MKQLFIILVSLLGITFLSCSDDEFGFSDAQKEIVGKWELVEAGDLLPPVGTSMRYEVYNIDGTYNTYYVGEVKNNNPRWEFLGWSTDDNMLIFHTH